MLFPPIARQGLLLLPLLFAAHHAHAQDGGQVHGNFSTDIQYYNEDSAIGAVVLPQRMGANGWGNIIYTNGAFEAGMRFESYTPPLAGYPAGLPYSGTGIGYRYARYTMSDLEVTVGNFFEQFGQGMVFRSYEERYLGVDNAMDGIRVKYRPVPGINLKGFVGQQRLNFANEAVKGPGTVRGIDAEISLSEFFDSTWTSANNLIVGGSFVSKYQEDRDPLLVLPENVGAYALRANFTTPRWNLYAEYAYKINDPNNKNGFIYKDGQGLLLNATYSVKGFGLSVGAHSFDNMFFQSDRSAATPFDLNINFLPPLAKQHTYNLPATPPNPTANGRPRANSSTSGRREPRWAGSTAPRSLSTARWPTARTPPAWAPWTIPPRAGATPAASSPRATGATSRISTWSSARR